MNECISERKIFQNESNHLMKNSPKVLNEVCHSLGIACSRGKVQFVFCPEEEVFGTDLQNGGWLDGPGQGK